ncbi:beta-lactamase family protein [Streptomyces sp. NBC_01351]|uniref:serine hydrolase domain-containing protein n=1 Tax=Streptomyces sp. NBC_01351 TaxID=2903833 RepID=UPI002E30D292|nr:serine hydrolase domain-containing protein [Streptomyces sp. NBC_01351]
MTNPTAQRTSSAIRKARWTTLVAAGAAVAALAAGAVPASAAERPAAPVTATPHGPRSIDTAKLAALMAPSTDVSGTLVRLGGSGVRWTGATGPLSQDPAANFRIGSITKLFTSTVVLQLIGEGRFTMDTPVQELLPGTLPAHWQPITVGQLLSHTSGLQEPCVDFRGLQAPPTPAQVISHWTDPKCAAPQSPVLVQQYNGANHFLLGMVIEKVTGRSYADEVQRRIARPLGLRHTYSPKPGDPAIPGPVLADPSGIDPWAWAEGGMISNAPDLERFMTALMRGRLLRPAEQRQLFVMPALSEGAKDRFSMGGLLRSDAGGTVVWGKTGSMGRSTSGVFATEHGARTVVYSLVPTTRDHDLLRTHIGNLVAAGL